MDKKQWEIQDIKEWIKIMKEGKIEIPKNKAKKEQKESKARVNKRGKSKESKTKQSNE